MASTSLINNGNFVVDSNKDAIKPLEASKDDKQGTKTEKVEEKKQKIRAVSLLPKFVTLPFLDMHLTDHSAWYQRTSDDEFLKITQRSKLPVHRIVKIPASLFNVRAGPDYDENKKKAPSLESLYDMVGCDFVYVEKKVDHMARFLQFNDVNGLFGGAENKKTTACGVPPVFVFTVQVPDRESVSSNENEKSGVDGPGYKFCFYFKIKDWVWNSLKEVEEILNSDSNDKKKEEKLSSIPNSIKLLKEYINAPNGHDMQLRFKIIAGIVNIDDANLPISAKAALMGYNFKPFLSRPQHRMYKGDGYFELVQDVYEFNWLTQWMLTFLTSKWKDGNDCVKNIVGNVAIVIEGMFNHELPEQVLGCFQFQRVELQKAPKWEPPVV